MVKSEDRFGVVAKGEKREKLGTPGINKALACQSAREACAQGNLLLLRDSQQQSSNW